MAIWLLGERCLDFSLDVSLRWLYFAVPRVFIIEYQQRFKWWEREEKFLKWDELRHTGPGWQSSGKISRPFVEDFFFSPPRAQQVLHAEEAHHSASAGSRATPCTTSACRGWEQLLNTPSQNRAGELQRVRPSAQPVDHMSFLRRCGSKVNGTAPRTERTWAEWGRSDVGIFVLPEQLLYGEKLSKSSRPSQATTPCLRDA